jgi:zinc transport system substrate-binding protein
MEDMVMKKILAWVAVLTALSLGFSGCSPKTETLENDERITVIATIFPEYDFLRQIGGDHLKLSMLLPPGAESHSFEPTPKDMIAIQNSKMFVYVGGESDAWIDTILGSLKQDQIKIVTLMDCVQLVEEETVEGMASEEEETSPGVPASPEYDEHVWTSPRNAKLIVQKLCDALCEIDSGNADAYKANTAAYLAKLDGLDQKFRDVVDNAIRKEIIVGDRFPFRYLVDAYGLTYYAAFPGCSTDTEANPAIVAFLIDKVKQDGIPIVFYDEFSNAQMCNSICEATGARPEQLNAAHNVSKEDFQAGVTYIDLMEHNVDVLREALN